MRIDKDKLHEWSWYENNLHERVHEDDPNIAYYRSRFPLMLTTTIYSCKIKEDDTKEYHEMFRVNNGFASGEECIVEMVNSGDYTLSEAIILYATSCERCNNALLYKYLNGKEGYPEFSEKWRKCNTVCEYCEGIEEQVFPSNNSKGIIEFDEEIKFPLNSMEINPIIDNNTNSTIYRYKKGIIHKIGVWPNEMHLQYEILPSSKRIILVRASYLVLPAGNGFPLKWKGDGTFYYESEQGYVLQEEHFIIKRWKDYFNIKEVKEFIKENYDINSDELFSLT